VKRLASTATQPGYIAKLVDIVRCARPQRVQPEDATTCFYVKEDEAWR
jgi:hypothetical protein